MSKKKRRTQKPVESESEKEPSRQDSVSETSWFVIGLLSLAALVASYLGFTSWQSGSVAGCGPGSGCGDVLSSRWSSWFGIPVSLLAIPFYLGLAVAVVRLGKSKDSRFHEHWTSLALSSSLVVAWAALWFTFIQAGVLGRFCPWCLTAHAAGLIASLMVCGKLLFPTRGSRRFGRLTNKAILNAAWVACLGVGLLVGGQLTYQPDTFTVVDLEQEEVPEASPDSTPSEKPESRDSLRLHGGRFQLKPSTLPGMGQSSAPHAMLSLFDYTCHHCRSTHQHLASLVEAFPNDLSIVSLPMPLNTECNPLMQRMGSKTPRAHQDACHYAALSLAVFRLKPESWQEFDHWLFTGKNPPPVGSANSRAAQLVGDIELLRQTLRDRWISEQVGLAVEIYEANMQANGQGRMPQMVIGSAILAGVVNDASKLFSLVREQFGLEAPSEP